MKASSYFTDYFENIGRRLKSVDSAKLSQMAEMAREIGKVGRKIIVVGNGGSAAIASHVTVDFTKAAGIRAVSFNEADLLTCFANDYGYPNWVARALEFYGDSGDLVILVSSSGKSPNMLKGAQQAKAMGLSLITLSGFSSENILRKMGDLNLWVDSMDYNVVELTHLGWLLSTIDYLIGTKEPAQ